MFALHHSASHQDAKDRAQHLLSRYPAAPEKAQQTYTPEDFDAVTNALLDELQIPETAPLTQQTPQAGETLIEPLSERELEILTLIGEGLSNRQIADQYFLSVGTVKWYTSHIFSKLGVQNRTLAMVRARQLKLIP